MNSIDPDKYSGQSPGQPPARAGAKATRRSNARVTACDPGPGPLVPRQGHWIALYGSLMRGLGSMDELGIGLGLRFVGPCEIPGELFDLGPYPGLRHGDGRVTGELYAILDADAVIPELDRFEGYDPAAPRESLYLREYVELAVPRGAHAWLYVYNGVPDASERVVPGDWRAHLAGREAGSTGRVASAAAAARNSMEEER